MSLVDVLNFDKKKNNNVSSEIDNLEYNFINSSEEWLGKNIDNLNLINKTTHIASNGRFSNYDLVAHILKEIGTSNIIRFTYSIAPVGARTYLKLANQQLIKSFVLIIDGTAKTRSKLALKLLKNFKIIFIKNHAKITLISNDTHNITILGSQNDSQGKRFEFFTIFTDNQTYNFYKNKANGFYK